MHDQVGVRMADRVADLADQVQPRRNAELARLAIAGDGFAVDIFQRQVRLAIAIDAGIQQACNEGMGEAGQDFALAVEALAQARVG